MKKRGFTLIELIMVIVIIGILAAIALPKYIDLRSEARKAACQASGGALRAAISNYYASAILASPGATSHWPSACTNTVLGGFVQSWPSAPTTGTWSTGYSSATGILSVGQVCP